MNVFKRIFVKVLLFLLVVVLAGGGAVGWRAYRQSTPEYAIEKYLSLLIDNSSEKAYGLLDQSEDVSMTSAEYAEALKEKKYSLYSGYKVDEVEKRRDNEGNEYTDYHVEFVNAGEEVQLEEDFTVKKQPEPLMGIFDQWKVLSGHCMVKNFLLTVPTGAEVYLDGARAEASWITRDNILPSFDCYRIPSLLPGKISLVIRHPAFESVNATLDALEGSADYSAQMPMKKSAQDECKETAIKALKQLYSGSAVEKMDELETLFADCLETAEDFVKKQGEDFNREDATFKSAGISDFAVQFGDPVFTEEANGAITTEMTLNYHYVVREDVTVDTEEVLEDGTPVQETKAQSDSGDNTAKFVMSFHDAAWHIASMEIPVIPE
ncbi:MAG: hypothetical protein Q4C61_12940 [Lachnospiraceae bacterium]|nr:hypothetical protein [Lachnospiraceae bacterium]